MARIGFIGLGIMGDPMCRNLLRAGHEVTVYNRTREKTAPLVEAGARAAGTIRDLLDRSEVVITMLSDPAAVSEVATREDGILRGLRPGKTWIDMSTVSPESSRAMAEKVRETGADYLEAPVLGSRKPAADATLVILTGGNAETAKRAEPILSAMGNRVIHMGEVGAAAQMKLIVNQIMATILCVFAEGALTGLAAGLSADRILEVLAGSVVDCPAIRIKGKDMLGERRFDVQFPLKHALKDLRLAASAGDAQGIPTPVTAAAWQLFCAARERGFGDHDFSAVLRGLTAR